MVIHLDVNILVNAFHTFSPHHHAAARWLPDALSGSDTVGVSDETFAAHIRITTNARAFPKAATPAEALAFCDAVRDSPSFTPVVPSPRRWNLLRHLVVDQHLRANDVPDAFLAATAIDAGATLVTFDHGFRRFPDLRVRVLDDPSSG